MSRAACNLCGKVVSTTHDPNRNEGFFVDDVAVEELQAYFENGPDAYNVYGYLSAMLDCARLVVCAKCQDTNRRG